MSRNTEELGDTRRRIKHLPIFLLVLILMGTVAGAFYVHRISQQEHSARFDSVKSNITEVLKSRFNFYENTLKQTGAFFMNRQTVTAEDFQTYVHNIGLIRRYPGMTAIGYAEYLPEKNLQKFIQNRRNEGKKDYLVWPPEEGRDFYTPVKYVEPFFRLIRELRGYDFVHSQKRRSAMIKSAAEGKPTVTEEVELFVEEPDSRPHGFNIFIPVYNSNTEPPTREERIKKTQGYVFGVFNGDHLFNLILRENDLFGKQAGIKIFLASDDGPRTKVYDSDVLYPSEESESLFEDEIRLTLGNREWIFQIRSLVTFEDHLSSKLRWIVLGFGFFIAIFFLLFTRHIEKINKILEKSNLELEHLANSNSLLFKAGQIGGSTLHTTTILKRFATFFIENFCDCCFIQIHNLDTFKLDQGVTAIREGELAECEKTLNAFMMSDHVTKDLIKEKKTLFQIISSALGQKSIVSIPLLIKGEVFGVVSLLYNKVTELTATEISVLERAVIEAATSIENSLLYKEAEISNRLKDEFLATVSHELRTPLTVILGYSHLLLRRNLEADVAKAITNISHAAENQETLIEDLLDVSAIVSGKVKFRPQTVSIRSIIQAAIESVQLPAQSKQIALEYKQHEDCKILGEKIRLKQIIWNLLSNSIKFTPEGGKINVSYEIDENFCRISIHDNGQGIDPEFLPVIFDKFRQEENTSTRSQGGLGLGLSIVSSLVKLHGGTIAAFSEGKGKGTTFVVTLPLMNAQSVFELKDETEIKSRLHNVVALIVDHDVSNLDLISRTLQGYDAVVYTATNVDDAMRVIREESINVVISELTMPEKDGNDLLHEIRAKENETGKHVPMLILSNFPNDKAPKEESAQGFDLFIAKPVRPDKLIGAIDTLVNRHESFKYSSSAP